MQDNPNELLPIVDIYGTVIGSASRGVCHNGNKLLHPVVHLHVFSPDGKLYLQKRPEWKDVQPGKWDTAVGGHIDLGEDVMTALFREAREELGLSGFNPEFISRYVFESDCERELINAFKCVVYNIPRPSDELAGGRFWTIGEILSGMGKQIFTPNFETEYRTLFLVSPDISKNGQS